MLSQSKEKVAEVLVDLARLSNCEDKLAQVVNKLLNFDLLKSKQNQYRHLFSVLAILLEKPVPAYLVENIKRFVRDVRKKSKAESTE